MSTLDDILKGISPVFGPYREDAQKELARLRASEEMLDYILKAFGLEYCSFVHTKIDKIKARAGLVEGLVGALGNLNRWQESLIMGHTYEDKYHQWVLDCDAAKETLAEARRVMEEKPCGT